MELIRNKLNPLSPNFIQSLTIMRKSIFELIRILTHLKFDINVGGKYYHYKDPSKIYKVINVGILEQDETPCVIYKSKDNGIVWVRSAESWQERVETADKKLITKFTPVD